MCEGGRGGVGGTRGACVCVGEGGGRGDLGQILLAQYYY